MHRTGRRDASWTVGVAFTSATPHAGRLSQGETNTRDASTMSIHSRREILYSLFSLMAVRDLLRDAMSSVVLTFFVTFEMYQSGEERLAVGRSRNVVSLKWIVR